MLNRVLVKTTAPCSPPEHGHGDVPTFYTCDEGLSALTTEGQATLERLEGMLAQSVAQQYHMAGVRTEPPNAEFEDGMEVEAAAMEAGQFEDADVEHWGLSQYTTAGELCGEGQRRVKHCAETEGTVLLQVRTEELVIQTLTSLIIIINNSIILVTCIDYCCDDRSHRVHAVFLVHRVLREPGVREGPSQEPAARLAQRDDPREHQQRHRHVCRHVPRDLSLQSRGISDVSSPHCWTLSPVERWLLLLYPEDEGPT
ncbi:hypothetical protein F7725_020156 [Dissostichus mawsoni]|uniref:Uncharacterized protein n=1 Tax=Dissostichus mawsoni TaxID=36200 RepID=A0A7J5YFR0_DISMA|nr:hypothetical protein F7725_020156 [Dissostichus mawsoni]